jgi:cysteine-rich repeat protein
MKMRMPWALTLLVGCPSDVTAPVIESFAVSAPIVATGGTVVLSWKVAGAAKVAIVAEPGGSVVETENLSGMATSSPITAVTVFVLTATGDDDLTTQKTLVVRPMDGAGVQITAFDVSPEAIPLGDSAELSWTVANATEIAIQDQDGTSVYQGADATGTQTVMPAETAAYTLTARGPSGTASQTVLLTVNPPGSARIVSFDAQPVSISIGGSATLSWSVENAPEGIEIRSGGTTIASDTNLTGTITVAPLVTTDYQLVALSPIGDARDTVTVTVAPSPPVIVDFDAMPNPTAIGGTTTLTWSVLGATRIRVLEDTTVHLDTTVDPGTFVVPVDQGMETFTLEASNGNGTVTEIVNVGGDAVPVIVRFQTSFFGFIDTATVTLSWDVNGATDLELVANGTSAGMFSGTSTGTMVFLTDTTVFELVAINGQARATAMLTVGRVQTEVEPNDTAATAMVLRDTINFINGGAGNGDLDFYAVDVPAGGFVFAATPPDLPPCVPGEIRLYDRDGVTIRGAVVSGPDGCSIMTPVVHPFARNLAGGRYYVSFLAFGPPQPYYLVIQTGGPGCGNGVREIGEGCDDANTQAGDGCSDTCTPEPLGAIQGPPGETTFPGSIVTLGEVDLYQVVMTAPGFIIAETYVPAFPSCPFGPAGDTVVELLDGMFQPIGFDDDGGVGSCSRLVQEVGTGTYFVAVRPFDAQAGLPAYQVRVAAVGFGCGNGVLEAGEGCDDGNLGNGDGCSAMCVFEGDPETEPNDDFDDPGVLTVNTTGAFTGSAVGGDVDYYAVVVPQGSHLSARILVNGGTACPPGAQLSLVGFFGGPLLFTAGVEPPNLCPSIMPVAVTPATNMTAGTYYLAVDSFDPMGLPSYQLVVDVIPPVCGNGIIDGTETCDDANTTPNDGCDATCALEILATVMPPGQVVSVPVTPGYATIAVEVTQPGQSISAMVVGACPPSLQMAFLDPDGQILGVGFNCAIPFPQAPPDVFNQDLAPDTYFVRIANTPAIDVDVQVIDPACGDAAVQLRAGEQCDDGGQLDGDGCSAACQIEVDGVFSLTATGAQTLAGVIPLGQRDLYRIDVGPANDLLVSIQTFVPDVASGCVPPDNDTVIELYDAVTLQQIAFNDDNNGLCSLIASITLTAGSSSYLLVRPFAAGGAIPAYEVRVTAVLANVCGNGILEPANGETCDDGNSAPGDGCDPMCLFEGNVVDETEINDNQATADPLGINGAGSAIAAGAVSLPGDDDVFSFTVPANQTLTFSARTHSVLTDVMSCVNFQTDTRIFLETAGLEATQPMTVELAYNDDISFNMPPAPDVFCSEIPSFQVDGGPAGATYYVRVQGFNDSSQPTYFMTVTLQ